MRPRLFLMVAVAGLLTWSASAMAQPITVASATHPEFGAHLTDGDGRSLYLFAADPAGESTCVDACAQNWPPLLTDGSVAAGPGVAGSLLGTITRRDGSLQVTYSNVPLYYFVDDVAAGDALGQGRGGAWYLISPFGTAIVPREAPAASTAAAAEPIEPMLLSSLMSEGSATYTQHCVGCHGSEGQGGNGPGLAGANLSDDRSVIRQIVRGSSHMPGFGSVLDDAQVAAVVTFIRNSWGNVFRPVVAEEVTSFR